VYGAANFGRFYEQFLLLLDYWITPWLGIIAVDFFVLKRVSFSNMSRIPGFSWRAIASYLVGVLISVAFIPSIGYFGFTGPVAPLIGGADFSYFVSFLVSAALYYLVSRK
jgi:NCS1 family nucleobase:cation symporter-1